MGHVGWLVGGSCWVKVGKGLRWRGSVFRCLVAVSSGWQLVPTHSSEAKGLGQALKRRNRHNIEQQAPISWRRRGPEKTSCANQRRSVRQRHHRQPKTSYCLDKVRYYTSGYNSGRMHAGFRDWYGRARPLRRTWHPRAARRRRGKRRKRSKSSLKVENTCAMIPSAAIAGMYLPAYDSPVIQRSLPCSLSSGCLSTVRV